MSASRAPRPPAALDRVRRRRTPPTRRASGESPPRPTPDRAGDQLARQRVRSSAGVCRGERRGRAAEAAAGLVGAHALQRWSRSGTFLGRGCVAELPRGPPRFAPRPPPGGACGPPYRCASTSRRRPGRRRRRGARAGRSPRRRSEGGLAAWRRARRPSCAPRPSRRACRRRRPRAPRPSPRGDAGRRGSPRRAGRAFASGTRNAGRDRRGRLPQHNAGPGRREREAPPRPPRPTPAASGDTRRRRRARTRAGACRSTTGRGRDRQPRARRRPRRASPRWRAHAAHPPQMVLDLRRASAAPARRRGTCGEAVQDVRVHGSPPPRRARGRGRG